MRSRTLKRNRSCSLCLHKGPWTHHQSALGCRSTVILHTDKGLNTTCRQWWILPVRNQFGPLRIQLVDDQMKSIKTTWPSFVHSGTRLWWHSLLFQNNPTVNAPPQCVIDCQFLFSNMKLFFFFCGGSAGTNELWAESERQEVRQKWEDVLCLSRIMKSDDCRRSREYRQTDTGSVHWRSKVQSSCPPPWRKKAPYLHPVSRWILHSRCWAESVSVQLDIDWRERPRVHESSSHEQNSETSCFNFPSVPQWSSDWTSTGSPLTGSTNRKC